MDYSREMYFISTSQQFDPTIDGIVRCAFRHLMTEPIPESCDQDKDFSLALIYSCMHFMQTHNVAVRAVTDNIYTHSTHVIRWSVGELANALFLGAFNRKKVAVLVVAHCIMAARWHLRGHPEYVERVKDRLPAGFILKSHWNDILEKGLLDYFLDILPCPEKDYFLNIPPSPQKDRPHNIRPVSKSKVRRARAATYFCHVAAVSHGISATIGLVVLVIRLII